MADGKRLVPGGQRRLSLNFYFGVSHLGLFSFPAAMRRQRSHRVSLSELRDLMEEIRVTVPHDATVDQVPNDQRWIIQAGLHHASERHAVYNGMFSPIPQIPSTNAPSTNAPSNNAPSINAPSNNAPSNN